MSAALLTRYNALVADRLRVDFDKLQELTEEFIASSASAANSPRTPEPSSPATPNLAGRCTYLLQAGKNKGQPCGAKESASGSARCKTHLKKTEGTAKTEPKEEKEVLKPKEFASTKTGPDTTEVPKAKPTSAKAKKINDHEKMEKAPVIAKLQKERDDIPIVKNKHGHYIHEGTCLIWDPSSRTVTGRELSNGSMIPLTENDIQLCMANGWKYKQDMKVTVDNRQVECDNDLYESDVSSSEEED